MRALLEGEGITFDEEGRVNMKRYGWNPARDLDEAEREAITAQAAPGEVSDRLMHLLWDDPASPVRVSPPAS
jgi:hypothetical protein